MANGRFGQSRIGWEFFGSELKRCREAAGLTQQELGRRVICSGSYIGQFETAMRKPQLDVAQRIDVELGTGGFLGRMCKELIDSSPYADCFAEAAYLEGMAATIREYAPTFVPGVLQTAAYGRAVFLGGFPFIPEDDIQARVAARLERARILDHPTEPLWWAILDESVIRRKTGGAAAMHEQLMHIASLVRRRRIGVQVVPFEAGHPVVEGTLSLMTFEEAPPLAYTEGHRTGALLDDPAMVARCVRSYDLARAVALPPAQSLSLIESVAEEYAHECNA
ncbi:helix-turn-helix domain-containing protein [Streptomyces cinnamoneus]|uniref:Transcriptional regulator n=1 Tax=Streptomyces cinnamoneus TaxID=53446 RepID=A0A918TZX8_STRCJ|nr:helix-turn-helix transcriptional regulator [Streptomyces cinnamoneus]GHC73471.1 transcriptional regulator [Streptomyces cinnamoneus]